jgi:hypothetical protein
MGREDKHALIIGTNGKYRLVSLQEAKEILYSLKDESASFILGSSDYLVIYNAGKAVSINEADYLVGSMLVMRMQEDKLCMMSNEEIAQVQELIGNRMETMISDDQTFSALELG